MPHHHHHHIADQFLSMLRRRLLKIICTRVADVDELYAIDVDCKLQQMRNSITGLLAKLNANPDDLAASEDDECCICAVYRASMQTFPCGHRVLCRRCFIRTIEIAVNDGKMPMRCVLCRTEIARLRPLHSRRVEIRLQQTPPISIESRQP